MYSFSEGIFCVRQSIIVSLCIEMFCSWFCFCWPSGEFPVWSLHSHRFQLLLTCDWLQRGWSHSHTESIPVWWLHCVAHGLTRGLTCWLCKRVHCHCPLTVYLWASSYQNRGRDGFFLIWVFHGSLGIKVWLSAATASFVIVEISKMTILIVFIADHMTFSQSGV